MAFSGKQYSGTINEASGWVTIPMTNNALTVYVDRLDASVLYYRINDSDNASGMRLLEGETATHKGDIQLRVTDSNARAESSCDYQIIDAV